MVRPLASAVGFSRPDVHSNHVPPLPLHVPFAIPNSLVVSADYTTHIYMRGIAISSFPPHHLSLRLLTVINLTSSCIWSDNEAEMDGRMDIISEQRTRLI